MNPLYTYGYGGAGRIEDLEAHVAAGAWVADIRFSPRSRFPEWRGDSLARRLRRYSHLQELGNRNYQSGPIQLADASVGLDRLYNHLYCSPIVLLCGCQDVSTCHRRVVAELAVARWPGLEVRHLNPGEALDGAAAAPRQEPMMALSLWQPWASLIAVGAKRVETRSWPAPRLGPIAIHAAKKWDGRLREYALEPDVQRYLPGDPDLLPRGVVVAVAELADCCDTETLRRDPYDAMAPDDHLFGNYSRGRYGWVLRNVRRLREPIPALGAQGLWSWTPPHDLEER